MSQVSKLVAGYEVVVQAAKDAGASMMYGYPITPTSDIFVDWIKKGCAYLQTEDEIAAGFAVCGALLAGQKAFTATAGPGHVLMQDALVMAEAMRLPFVMVVGQRGAPSSGTVIYSQQEVALACRGGNSEGMRFVFSPSTVEELYRVTRDAFNVSWRFRFPAIVLSDGYLLKTKLSIPMPSGGEVVASYPLVPEGEAKHLQNIYSLEEELHEVLQKNAADFSEACEGLTDYELFGAPNASVVVVAHGIIGASAKSALADLQKEGKNISLFRPITLQPFPSADLRKVVAHASKIIVIESAFGQLRELVYKAFGAAVAKPVVAFEKPAMGIEPEEIVAFCREHV